MGACVTLMYYGELTEAPASERVAAGVLWPLVLVVTVAKGLVGLVTRAMKR